MTALTNHMFEIMNQKVRYRKDRNYVLKRNCFHIFLALAKCNLLRAVSLGMKGREPVPNGV